MIDEHRWIGFEPITTASLTKRCCQNPDQDLFFQRSIQIELPSVIENVGFEPRLCVPGAVCCTLHHILISNPSGNRTRASGATVRRTHRYTMRLFLIYGQYITGIPACHLTCGINLSRGLSPCHPLQLLTRQLQNSVCGGQKSIYNSIKISFPTNHPQRAVKNRRAHGKCKHTVHYYETDRGGFYPPYPTTSAGWRKPSIDFFDQLGWSYQKFEDEGVISPVTAIECKYKQTTTFPEEVYISVTVEGFRGLKLKLNYTMTNAAGNIVCEASSEHCFLGKDGGFIRIKKEYPEFWQVLSDIAISE